MNKKNKPKILWGVCGIGHGHTFRQMPLIEHFAKASDILIFAYGQSHKVLSHRFQNHPAIKVEEVAVPYYKGNSEGLDFSATASHPANQKTNFVEINAAAMASASKQLGKPNLVISDYEPVSAQYAYAQDVPLVTMDQQSKYLTGEFEQPLNGEWFNNETQLLRMFFPKANLRLACSFFKVTQRSGAKESVEIFPPVLSDTIINMQRKTEKNRLSIVIYISAQQPFGQSMDEVIRVCQQQSNCQFHVFGQKEDSKITSQTLNNITFYEHGHAAFHKELAKCDGIVSTAGHTLLSEAMHLGIPVYAIPLPVYEQQMNANIIDKNSFGVSHPCLSERVLSKFIDNLQTYKNAILKDDVVLLRGSGKNKLIQAIETQLNL